MAGLLDYLDRFYANDGLAGLLGMKSAGKQMEENNAKVESLAEEGQGPMLNRKQFAAMLDNPMVFALGTGNVGKVTPQMLSKLPMDEASRMARAKAMGFDTDVYHGTASDFREFKPSNTGEFGPGVYTTTSPFEASSYTATNMKQFGTGQNVMPLMARIKNPLVIKSPSEFWDRFGVDGGADADAVKNAIKAGYDSIVYERPVAVWNDALKKSVPTGEMQKHIMVFDPKNIRSRFAAFDPAKKDSSDLLASIGLLGMIGGGAALTNGEEQY